MGIKAKNLQKLLDDKVNVHRYVEINQYDDLLKYSENHPHFSIRFDRDLKEKGLPFYVYDEEEHLHDRELFLKKICQEMKELDCSLICSDGHQFDQNLKFNFVIDIDKEYNFILELSSNKVPLRLMYQYKTTIIRGNLLSNKYDYFLNDNKEYNVEDIEYLLFYLLDKKYKYVEGTMYNKKVGMLNDYIVIWQTD